MIQEGLHFIQAQTAESLVAIFWLVLFIEIPRYAFSVCAMIWAIMMAKRHAMRPAGTSLHSISVLIATHNDAQAIQTTIASLREQIGVKLEIIVINDGSTDDTDACCKALVRQGYIDRYFFVRSRGGKAAALNLGLQYAAYPYILATDADTTFNRNALSHAMAYFHDKAVGCVSGNLRVRNGDTSLATRVQRIDYLFSITVGRIVNDKLGFYFVVSGAFGLFKKEALHQVGGWHCGPGDDSDLSVRLRLAGYKARFAPFALAMTNAPTSFTRLARQRLRWNRSVIRVRFRKYRWPVHNPFLKNFNPLLALSFWGVYYFNAIHPISVLMYSISLFAYHGSSAWVIVTSVHLVYMFLGSTKFLVALCLSEYKKEDATLLCFMPLFSIINTLLLRVIAIYATINELVFTGSYEDGFVPAKVRRYLKRYA